MAVFHIYIAMVACVCPASTRAGYAGDQRSSRIQALPTNQSMILEINAAIPRGSCRMSMHKSLFAPKIVEDSQDSGWNDKAKIVIRARRTYLSIWHTNLIE